MELLLIFSVSVLLVPSDSTGSDQSALGTDHNMPSVHGSVLHTIQFSRQVVCFLLHYIYCVHGVLSHCAVVTMGPIGCPKAVIGLYSSFVPGS